MNLVTRNQKGAPLSAADHDSNIFGVQAGVRNVLQDGAAADGTTDARAAIAQGDAAAVAASVDLFFSAGTYRIASNLTISSVCRFAKGAKLKPDSGVTITLTEGFLAGDWQHVFDISTGGKIAALGMAQEYCTPQHFGALGNGTNDDSPAIQAAVSLGAVSTAGLASFPVRFPVNRGGTHYYRLGATIYVHRCLQIQGMGNPTGRFQASVKLRPVPGLMAAMVILGGSSTARNTECEPANPAHKDPWKVHEVNSSSGFVNLYVCKQPHTASADNRPGHGANYETYWTEYKSGGDYPSGQRLIGDARKHAPAWTSGVGYNTSPGLGFEGAGAGTVVENLNFEPVTAGTVRFGIVHTCPAHFSQVTANNFEMAGIIGRGQTSIGYCPLENLFLPPGSSNSPDDFARIYDGQAGIRGNVNGSTYTNVRCSWQRGGAQGGGHGIVCEGNNAGIVRYDNCDATQNQGAGFVDNSAVGSHYLNCHTAQNTWKVLCDGLMYMCIKGHQSNAPVTRPATGSDWRRYWTRVGSTQKDADWSDSAYYVPCGAINVSHKTLGFANIINHYSEGGIEKGIVPRSRTLIFGGQWTSGTDGLPGEPGITKARLVYHPEFEGAFAMTQGGRFLNSFGRVGVTDPWGTPTESGFWIGAFSSLGSFESSRIYSFGDGRDDKSSTFTAVRLAWSTTTNSYQWTKASVNRPILAFTGTNFNRGGYSGTENDGLPVAPGGILLGTNAQNYPHLVKLMAVNAGNLAGALSALSGQTAVRGQRWYFNQPVAGGSEGVVCVTGGTVGGGATLKEFGAISA